MPIFGGKTRPPKIANAYFRRPCLFQGAQKSPKILFFSRFWYCIQISDYNSQHIHILNLNCIHKRHPHSQIHLNKSTGTQIHKYTSLKSIRATKSITTTYKSQMQNPRYKSIDTQVSNPYTQFYLSAHSTHMSPGSLELWPLPPEAKRLFTKSRCRDCWHREKMTQLAKNLRYGTTHRD